MSSSRSLLGLPRLPVPSSILIMTPCIFPLSSILHKCSNTLNFLLITAWIKSSFMSSRLLVYIHLHLSPSESSLLAATSCSIHFECQNSISISYLSAHASQAYKAVLVVWIICLLFHAFVIKLFCHDSFCFCYPPFYLFCAVVISCQ